MRWQSMEQLRCSHCRGCFSLAGWQYLPKVDQGKIRVFVQSPEGIETELTERSKMHYLDQATFWAMSVRRLEAE